MISETAWPRRWLMKNKLIYTWSFFSHSHLLPWARITSSIAKKKNHIAKSQLFCQTETVCCNPQLGGSSTNISLTIPPTKLTNDLKALSFVLNERSLTLLKEEQIKFDFEKRLLLSSLIMSSLCYIYNKLLNDWPSPFHLFWTLYIVPVYLNTCTWKNLLWRKKVD